MLSAHFWMGTGVTLGVAAVLGFGLGSYVTSPQAPARAASATIDTAIDDDGVEEAGFTTQKGPGAIHCTGCGPTLAERRWKADMAGLDSVGPMDTSYEVPSDDYAMATVVEPPVPVNPLPPKITRFVSGDTPSPPATMTRQGQEATPPPQIVLPTETESILPQ
ncbi:hypothetical protein [Sphingobium sp. WCS2017Hpa-17]|uniref:hypothetical protein n=1 Tax=Sphingobium sp. WCS2017Hpa-17 TaxID=3073638 RepID=UPI002889B034|nr:hypothetical protein [Sphingobium sp. WCS2017Hpa-17]